MSALSMVRLAAAATLCLALGCLGAAPANAGSAPAAPAASAPVPAPAKNPMVGARQLVLVVAGDWSTPHARMARFERDSASGSWRAVGGAFDANVGRKGLGWGRGLHGVALGPGPVKREGDAKAPAGVFALGPAFASDPSELGLHGLPVLNTSHGLVCVDDMASAHYNGFVDGPRPADADWNSSETMLRPDGLYRMGAFVEHNVSPRVPGGGSCIFMHIQEGPGVGTSGCTSMEVENLSATLHWLSASARPVLVQLPRAEYERLRGAWGLPDIGD